LDEADARGDRSCDLRIGLWTFDAVTGDDSGKDMPGAAISKCEPEAARDAARAHMQKSMERHEQIRDAFDAAGAISRSRNCGEGRS